MSSSSICLFHNRKYSSNIQRILNLLRIHIIKIKCDLNMTGKKSLCTCNLSDEQMVITDEEFLKKEQEYEEIKSNLIKSNEWSTEIDEIIELKIKNICQNQILIYKLFQLICDISNQENINKQFKSNSRQRHSNLICRHIELSTPLNQIGHLLGRDGQHHKLIVKETNTRIHFNNVPYSIPKKNECPVFNLDLFQSSNNILTATIKGYTEESVQNAIQALEELDQRTKV